MAAEVLCLRPAADFARVGVTPPDALTIHFRAPDAEDVPVLMRRVQGLVIPAVGPVLPASLFDSSAVRVVQVTGAGVDRLDRAAMEAMGIPVCNVPGGSNAALAEYAVSSALFLLRRFGESSRLLRAGDYAGHRATLLKALPPGLGGLTVGVVGLGAIGLDVARAFRAMGARLIYADPAPRDPAAAAALGAEARPLEVLLAESDVVTLHIPLLPATRGLIGAREIAAMKPGAVLIQAARGGIVDEQALAAALESGHLGGAAVDVHEAEPPSPDAPLFHVSDAAAARLILSPHIAGVTRQSWATLFENAWSNILRVVRDGAAPTNRVY